MEVCQADTSFLRFSGGAKTLYLDLSSSVIGWSDFTLSHSVCSTGCPCISWLHLALQKGQIKVVQAKELLFCDAGSDFVKPYCLVLLSLSLISRFLQICGVCRGPEFDLPRI